MLTFEMGFHNMWKKSVFQIRKFLCCEEWGVFFIYDGHHTSYNICLKHKQHLA